MALRRSVAWLEAGISGVVFWVDLRSCVPFLSGQGDGDDRRALARVRLAHCFNEGGKKRLQ